MANKLLFRNHDLFLSILLITFPASTCLAGDFRTALAWQDKLIWLHKALFADASPAPTKFALARMGLCREDVRLPLAPCSEAARAQVLEALRAAGINWS